MNFNKHPRVKCMVFYIQKSLLFVGRLFGYNNAIDKQDNSYKIFNNFVKICKCYSDVVYLVNGFS